MKVIIRDNARLNNFCNGIKLTRVKYRAHSLLKSGWAVVVGKGN